MKANFVLSSNKISWNNLFLIFEKFHSASVKFPLIRIPSFEAFLGNFLGKWIITKFRVGLARQGQDPGMICLFLWSISLIWSGGREGRRVVCKFSLILSVILTCWKYYKTSDFFLLKYRAQLNIPFLFVVFLLLLQTILFCSERNWYFPMQSRDIILTSRENLSWLAKVLRQIRKLKVTRNI